ncbi:hypothetical protein D3C86_1739020 [compost metagenome]
MFAVGESFSTNSQPCLESACPLCRDVRTNNPHRHSKKYDRSAGCRKSFPQRSQQLLLAPAHPGIGAGDAAKAYQEADNDYNSIMLRALAEACAE